jgi:arsenical pump membrane protein
VAPGPSRDDLSAALLVGVNLGPNLTTIGSLATMVWLVLLRRLGIVVSTGEYLRVGALTTLSALLAAAAALWVVVRVSGAP